MRLSLCEALTRETRPGHNTGNYVPYSFRYTCISSLKPTKNYTICNANAELISQESNILFLKNKLVKSILNEQFT